ncbi:unnamed protein product [Urochloa decumbens]|uniref:Zinc finger GRF-type domain-containing protein n=1 Tax=Urochloa decumbens TaxID=240449 RepID=A0ABC8XJR9_9POAL
MAGQWSGSPMKVASTGSSFMASSKRECPNCHVPLVRIQSKQPATKDEWFLVCPYNVKGDPTTCGFIRSELQYEALEEQKRRQQADKGASGDCYAELKEELQELKQIVNSVVEAKGVVDTRKCHVVLDGSVLYPVVFGFLGVLVGVFVGRLLK